MKHLISILAVLLLWLLIDQTLSAQGFVPSIAISYNGKSNILIKVNRYITCRARSNVTNYSNVVIAIAHLP